MPRAALRLELAAPAAVSLRVHDAQERLVAGQAARDLPAGAQRLDWEAPDDEGRPLPTGLYLLQLQAGALSRRLRAGCWSRREA